MLLPILAGFGKFFSHRFTHRKVLRYSDLRSLKVPWEMCGPPAAAEGYCPISRRKKLREASESRLKAHVMLYPCNFPMVNPVVFLKLNATLISSNNQLKG